MENGLNVTKWADPLQRGPMKSTRKAQQIATTATQMGGMGGGGCRHPHPPPPAARTSSPQAFTPRSTKTYLNNHLGRQAPSAVSHPMTGDAVAVGLAALASQHPQRPQVQNDSVASWCNIPPTSHSGLHCPQCGSPEYCLAIQSATYRNHLVVPRTRRSCSKFGGCGPARLSDERGTAQA